MNPLSIEFSTLWSQLVRLWPELISLIHIIGAMAVTVDAVLRKRFVPAIIGWVGLAWLAPIVGSLLYLWFGINRLHRTANALNLDAARSEVTAGSLAAAATASLAVTRHPSLLGLDRLGRRVTGNPLYAGNTVEPLYGGDAAYPSMLAAIDGAQESVTLCSYIFDNDVIGTEFVTALARAQDRGVAVRVLVDGVGARYSRPTIRRALRQANLTAAAFLPTRLPRFLKYSNLRNHRKIMVVDGTVGFTGGMNIRDGHCLDRDPTSPVECVHFRIEGPVVIDLQRTFAIDWLFSSGETLQGKPWFSDQVVTPGDVLARGVPGGPDKDLDNLMQVLMGALSVATHSVYIVTPYFLPDMELNRMLQITAMRGVEVHILLPEKSNVPLMDWAMMPQLPYLLEAGCRLYRTPAPFDHSKLMVVDDGWSLIGSSNWDPRSLRLNFEFNVECYDHDLAFELHQHIAAKIERARPVTLEELYKRGFGLQMRDGLTRLLSPYL